jgi:putative (di)nucleoside polyphosphate hydrolase
MRRPDRPFVGQCHWWVLGELLAPDEAIRFDLHTPEFDAFEWVEPSEALARVVAFKREAYREAMCDLGLLPHNNSTGKS